MDICKDQFKRNDYYLLATLFCFHSFFSLPILYLDCSFQLIPVECRFRSIFFAKVIFRDISMYSQMIIGRKIPNCYMWQSPKKEIIDSLWLPIISALLFKTVQKLTRLLNNIISRWYRYFSKKNYVKPSVLLIWLLTGHLFYQFASIFFLFFFFLSFEAP